MLSWADGHGLVGQNRLGGLIDLGLAWLLDLRKEKQQQRRQHYTHQHAIDLGCPCACMRAFVCVCVCARASVCVYVRVHSPVLVLGQDGVQLLVTEGK